MVATDSKGNLYTGEVLNGERVQRFLAVRLVCVSEKFRTLTAPRANHGQDRLDVIIRTGAPRSD